MGADSLQPAFLNLLYSRLAGCHLIHGFPYARRIAWDDCLSFFDANPDFTDAYLNCADANLNCADVDLNFANAYLKCSDAYLNLEDDYLNFAGGSLNIAEGYPAIENPTYG